LLSGEISAGAGLLGGIGQGLSGLGGAERVNDFETPFVMRLASKRV
jgi:hypothetical protein